MLHIRGRSLRGEFFTNNCLEHDDKWKFKCGFCEEIFEEKRDLKNHLFIHPESGANIPLPKLEIKEKKKKSGKPYHELPKKICVECGWSGINLSTHMKREHHNQIYRYLSSNTVNPQMLGTLKR